jgi:hypothetical protein
MSNISGATVVLASVSLLVLGGCATTGVREIPSNGGNAPSASPSIAPESQPKFDGPRDMNVLPQAL